MNRFASYILQTLSKITRWKLSILNHFGIDFSLSRYFFSDWLLCSSPLFNIKAIFDRKSVRFQRKSKAPLHRLDAIEYCSTAYISGTCKIFHLHQVIDEIKFMTFTTIDSLWLLWVGIRLQMNGLGCSRNSLYVCQLLTVHAMPYEFICNQESKCMFSFCKIVGYWRYSCYVEILRSFAIDWFMISWALFFRCWRIHFTFIHSFSCYGKRTLINI